MIFLLFPGSAAEQARNGLFVQLGADDDQLAAHIGTAGADLPLAGHIVELQPAVGAAVHDALGPQDHAVLAGIQLREGVLDIRLGNLLGGLDAPAREDLVGVVAVVVMMVVMAAAAVAVLIMMMLVLVVLVIIVVVVMLMLIIIVVVIVMVVAAAVVILILVVVMMVMLVFVLASFFTLQLLVANFSTPLGGLFARLLVS